MTSRSLGALMAISVALYGCNSDDDTLAIPEGCNPIAFEHDCLLPYPSDFFRVDDPSLPSGKRTVLTDAAKLVANDGSTVDLLALHAADGFSPGNQILALFPQGIDDAPLVGAADDLGLSLGAESPTILMRADTGERVLHLAETDPRAPEDARRALAIRPLVRLEDDTRYIVALRGLTTRDGTPLDPPAGFVRLRDRGDTGHPALAPLAARYDADVFAPLDAAGVPRSELLLAWDFTTRTRANTMADMLAVRQQVIEAFTSTAPRITVVSVTDQPKQYQHRRIEATVEVPLFLESAEPMAPLYRDASGRVAQNGSVQIPFTVIVPESVATRPMGSPPARLLQFGHGFFGDRSETNDYADQLADEHGFVLVAADWWGMSAADRTPITDVLLTDTGRAMIFTDRVHQAMANFMAVAYAATGPLAGLPELAVGTMPLFDGTPLYFYGISLGHILGSTYLGLSPLIDRAVLSVGGANLSFMMFRARPWLAFLALLQSRFSDKLDQQKIAMLIQSSFDRIDPIDYAPLIMAEPLPDGPSARRVLMHTGIGDTSVPNMAAHIQARTLGLDLLDPAPRSVTGLAARAGPLDSAIVEFDFGIEPLPDLVAIPPTSDSEAHESVRRLTAAKEQLDRFLLPNGRVEHTCDGPCDPE